MSTSRSQAQVRIKAVLGPTARIAQKKIAGLVETQVVIIGENWARLIGMALLGKNYPE